MKNRLKTLDYNGTGIVFTADGWLNATASASALNKPDLDNFLRSKPYQEYADVVAAANSVNSTELKRTKQGNGGGTFLHPEMAVIFARWISPAFAYWCDKQVATLIRLAQEAPARNAQLRTRRMQKLGAAPEAIAARNEGVGSRRVFTDQLMRRGVRQDGFADCTRALYAPLFGGSTDTIKKNYGLPDGANVRDHMNAVQLAAVSLTELLSAERIEKQRDYGTNACVETCNKVAKEVAGLITSNRRLAS
jgi:hypothetical protein